MKTAIFVSDVQDHITPNGSTDMKLDFMSFIFIRSTGISSNVPGTMFCLFEDFAENLEDDHFPDKQSGINK
jgi:hypothetical protein